MVMLAMTPLDSSVARVIIERDRLELGLGLVLGLVLVLVMTL